MKLGDPMFPTTQECVEFVLVSTLNFVSGRAWVAAVEARWLKVGTTLRRFLMATAQQQVPTSALKDVKLEFIVDDSIVKALDKGINADANDFFAKNRLRLLRIVRELGNDSAIMALAGMVVCSRPIDYLQYGGGPKIVETVLT